MTIKKTSEAQHVSAGLSRSNAMLQKTTTLLLDLIFPPRCAGCERVDYHWCDRCMAALQTVPLTVQQQIVNDMLTVAATSLHEGIIQRAIHGLKYENVIDVGQPLGNRLAEAFSQLNWQIDTIVSVPLHTTRLAQRGYNQANVIGEVMAQLHTMPFRPESVLRNRATQSQVTLNREERLTNMDDAFLAIPDHVTSKNILIIDDVFTTGATLVGVAQALTDAGAAMVYGLTVTTASPLSTIKD